MPKKFGVNTKKEEAKERKEQIKKEKTEKEIEKIENEYWKETDEKVLKKLKKNEEKEKSKQEKLEKKKEVKELLMKEEEEMDNESKKKKECNVVTYAIAQNAKEEDLKRLADKKNQENIKNQISTQVNEIDADEEYVNQNFLKMEEYKDYLKNGVDFIDESGIDNIMNSICLGEEMKHPEKKMKAAWKAYVDKYYQDLKKQYPKYRRQKLLDVLSNDFHKSMENPMYVYKIQKQKEILRMQLQQENNK